MIELGAITLPAAASLLAGGALWALRRRQPQGTPHTLGIEGAVLAGWAKRCGAECAREWNETVGKVLGLKAPTG